MGLSFDKSIKTAKNSVSALYVNQALEGIRQENYNLEDLLYQCHLTEEDLYRKEQRIEIDKAVKLYKLCYQVTQDESLCQLEHPTQLGHFRILALSLLNTRTLGKALRRMTEFNNLFHNSFHFSINTSHGQTTYSVERIPGHKILTTHAIDGVLSLAHRFLGWLCNDRIILNQVSLDFSPPDYKNEHKHLYYGAPVLYNQPINSFSFDNSYLDHRIMQNEASVESYIRRSPLDLHLPIDVGGALTQSVRLLTKKAFTQQKLPPELDDIASHLNYKSHTLRRRLSEEGTNFHTIQSQVRRDIAIHHLGHPETSIEEIALHTGYSEPSAFIRAFKNWTGFTPLQFRKGMIVDEP
ncbi:AraC family transcriptional regulator [Maricurvus nonylphenolicus]|uniref:AraC family transcriptional regulator n=1 Tax=Maricurvus nonylphenolicus TaxID=1008307 RepID=UPI0036F241EE